MPWKKNYLYCFYLPYYDRVSADRFWLFVWPWTNFEIWSLLFFLEKFSFIWLLLDPSKGIKSSVRKIKVSKILKQVKKKKHLHRKRKKWESEIVIRLKIMLIRLIINLVSMNASVLLSSSPCFLFLFALASCQQLLLEEMSGLIVTNSWDSNANWINFLLKQVIILSPYKKI